jgi:hypothetical protein
MESMHELARRAIEQMPPQVRFRPEDAKIIQGQKEVLLLLEGDVVKGFYDTLYAHPPTSKVFVDGERPDREMTLLHWYRRTVIGPLNDQYFAWMAMVGLVHVTRQVSNPMMLAMADYVAQFVAERAVASEMGQADADALVDAFRRLTATVGAIITYGYDQATVSALFDVAGMPETLLNRLRDQEITAALVAAREEVARRP